jgi:hypothetical protein
MAILSGEEGWLRVRPPLVALERSELDELRGKWTEINGGGGSDEDRL